MALTSVEDALLAVVALPLVAAPVAYALGRLSRRAGDALIVLTLAVHLALAARLALAVAAQGYALRLADPAGSPLGLGLPLSAGPLNAATLALVAFVALVVAAFSTAYVQPGRRVEGYLALLLTATAALDVVLLAGDLVTLAGGLALAGGALAGLVGLDFARDGGRAAEKLLATLGLAAALTAAVAWLILGRGGSIELDGLLARNAGLGGWLQIVAWLLLAILAMAAALAPAHTWLTTGSRHAITPVAALLAGGALPAALVTGLRLLDPGPGGKPVWPALALLGALTVVVAALGALRTPEFRPALAFQALGQVGLAAIALAEGDGEARALALFVAASLALTLPLATLGVGAVLQTTKADRLGDFARLRAIQPGAAALALVGAASLAGLPPFPGYWSRLWLLESLLRPGPYHLPLLLVTVAGSALLTGAILRLVGAGPAPGLPVVARTRPAVIAPLAGLALAGLALPLAPADIVAGLAGMGGTSVGAPSWTQVAAAALTLAAAALGISLRLAEVEVLPAGLQSAYDASTAWLTRGLGLVGRVQKRVRPGWLDPYAVVAGLLALAAWAAALVLDNTLGRLGREG